MSRYDNKKIKITRITCKSNTMVTLTTFKCINKYNEFTKSNFTQFNVIM